MKDCSRRMWKSFFFKGLIYSLKNNHFFRKKDLIEVVRNALSSAPSYGASRPIEVVL